MSSADVKVSDSQVVVILKLSQLRLRFVGVNGAKMTIPRTERLRITQQVYSKWSEIYDQREDDEAENAYAEMYVQAMAEAEKKYKDRPENA